MNRLSQYFINPGYAAAGIALILVPIAIHLINRYRYRRVRWAAMDFLLTSRREHRRKLLLQQLLLLLLRIAVVLGIVGLIARPYLAPGSSALFQGERGHVVILLDDSLSMQDRSGDQSGFNEAVSVVVNLAEERTRGSGTDTMTLLLLSKPEEPLLTQAAMDSTFATELRTRLEKLRCSHQRGDLSKGVSAAVEHLRLPAGSKTFFLISDFRGSDWDEEGVFSTEMKALREESSAINLVRVFTTPHENLGITKLEGDLDSACAGVPIRLSCTVKNFGENPAKNVGIVLYQDEAILPFTPTIDDLSSGSEQSVDFEVRFSSEGAHSLRASLSPDALEGDNHRYLALNLRTEHRVLIVNGNPGDGEGDFAADALSPVSGLTGFSPVIVDPEFLRRQAVDSYESIHLVNVSSLPADSLKILTDYVRDGGGLSWHLGPEIAPDFYNESLYADGTGLFPVPIGEIHDFHQDATNPGSDMILETHPVFFAFRGEDNPFVSDVTISRHFGVPEDRAIPESTRIIGRLSNGSPLFAEKTFGNGRIFASLTSCGSLWNNWPKNPSYVIFWLELEKYLLRKVSGSGDLHTGDPLEIRVDPTEFRNIVEIRTPDPQATSRITLTPPVSQTPDAPGRSEQVVTPPADFLFQDQFRNTDLPGIYRFIEFRMDESTEVISKALNVPNSEGDLSIASRESIYKCLGSGDSVRIRSSDEIDWSQGISAGREIKDLLIAFLAVILLVEQFLAMKLGFHPPNEPVRGVRAPSARGGG